MTEIISLLYVRRGTDSTVHGTTVGSSKSKINTARRPGFAKNVFYHCALHIIFETS
jgi:hypothetical protein